MLIYALIICMMAKTLAVLPLGILIKFSRTLIVPLQIGVFDLAKWCIWRLESSVFATYHAVPYMTIFNPP